MDSIDRLKDAIALSYMITPEGRFKKCKVDVISVDILYEDGSYKTAFNDTVFNQDAIDEALFMMLYDGKYKSKKNKLRVNLNTLE